MRAGGLVSGTKRGTLAIVSLALLATGCSSGDVFVAWPTDLAARWFGLVTEADLVVSIYGPYSESSPPPKIEFEEPRSFWIVEPDAERLRSSSSYVGSEDPLANLELQLREELLCPDVRHAADAERLFVPAGSREDWRALEPNQRRFERKPAPPWAADLEWALPASEDTCSGETMSFAAFGAEPEIFSPSTSIPGGGSPGLWLDLNSIARIDEDRIVAASDLVLYLFRRGQKQDSVEAPNTILASAFLPAPIPDAIWALREVTYLPSPRPRAIVILSLVHATIDLHESVIFSVDIDGDRFGEFRPITFADDLGWVAKLDEQTFLAVGGRTVVAGTSSGTPAVRELPSGWRAQRIYVSRDRSRIFLGSTNGLIWSGSLDQLLNEPIQIEAYVEPPAATDTVSGIVGFMEVDDGAGGSEVWAATYRAELLRRTPRGEWALEPLVALHGADDRSCLGPADACQRVEWTARIRSLVPASSRSFFVVSERCAEVLRYDPDRRCSERIEYPVSERWWLGADASSQRLLLGGVGGLLLEAEGPP